MGKKTNGDHSSSRKEKENEELFERLKEIVTDIGRRNKKGHKSGRSHRRDRSQTRHGSGSDRIQRSGRSRSRYCMNRSRDSTSSSRRSRYSRSSNSDHSRDSRRSRSGYSRHSGRSRSGHSRRSRRSPLPELRNRLRESPRESEGEREESPAHIQENDEMEIDNEQGPADPPALEPAAQVNEEQQADVAAQNIQNQPEHEVDLEEDVLNVIGPRLDPDQHRGPALHKDIAIRWMDIFKNGISKEDNKKLLEKYKIPENCGYIVAPELNTEVIAAIQDNVKTRDKRIAEKQERIAACIAAMGKAISICLKLDSKEKLELLETLNDTGRLLAFLQREESEIRKNLILANLNSSVRGALTGSAVDGLLFGANLEEKIKAAKTIERASKDLIQGEKFLNKRNPKNQRGPPTQRQLTRKRNPTSSGPKRLTNDKFGPRAKKTYPQKTQYPDRRR